MNIQRGEVIRINLNPTRGRDQSGNARPCLVISHTEYNIARKGIVIVTPITSIIKPNLKIMIPIPNGFKIQGSVIVEQVRTVDLNTCFWKTTEEILPQKFVDRVVNTFRIIIS